MIYLDFSVLNAHYDLRGCLLLYNVILEYLGIFVI